MDNLLSGLIGGLIGTLISSLVSVEIFRRQARIESNRIFVHDLLQVLQRIYLFEQSAKRIPPEDIDFLISFGAIALKDFSALRKHIDELSNTILQYNEGVKETLIKTEASRLEVTARDRLTKQITAATEEIRKLT
jgi:hypothetical protein